MHHNNTFSRVLQIARQVKNEIRGTADTSLKAVMAEVRVIMEFFTLALPAKIIFCEPSFA